MNTLAQQYRYSKPGQSRQKYRYSNGGSAFDEAKKMYIIIGICALAVIIGLVLLLTLQGGKQPEIPVVEQGDGAEDDVFLPDDTLTSIGDIIIDDGGAPSDEFTVTVTGADGLYQRSGEGVPMAALTITGQNPESFGFLLALPESTVEGVAYFNGAQTAICEKADGALEFSFDAGAVSVTVDGTLSELGGADAGGVYAFIEAVTTTTTTTTTTTAAPTEGTTAPPPSSGKYDLDSIKSDAVQDALSNLMPAGEYQLLNSLLDASGGYGMIYGTGDSSKEVQGRRFNLDTQMNAVFYYVSGGEGAGREAVVICGDNGRLVYVGFCDGSSYKYYTNDPERKSPSGAPRTISQYAKAKKMTLEG